MNVKVMNEHIHVTLQAVSSVRGMSQEDDNLSDSGHNSMSSLPPYRPPFRPHLAHIRSVARLWSKLYFAFKWIVAVIDFFFLMTVWDVIIEEI